MTAARLKASILQLAVTGKLVPQDPADEPAGELLKRILAAKASKGGPRSRAAKPAARSGDSGLSGLSGISGDSGFSGTSGLSTDAPFKIPANWVWCKLGDVGIWKAGATPNKSIRKFFVNGTIPWLLTGDLNDGLITKIPHAITECALAETSVKLNPEGSVLIAMYGATIGKVGILRFAATTNQACCACEPFEGVFNWFLFYFLMSQRNMFISRGEGGAQSNISKEKIVATPFPLPPLAEQKRIVAKIEELMPLVEEYGKLEEKRLQLDADLPGALEKAILQDAIQGKLVPHDPAEGTATELLREIQTAKNAKGAKGKSHAKSAKSAKASSVVSVDVVPPDDQPFEIPSSWAWCKLGDVSEVIRGSGIKRSETTSSGIPCIRYGEIYTTYGFSFREAKSFTSKNVADKCAIARRGDVLCTLTGECKEEIAKTTTYLGEVDLAVGGDLAKISKHPYEPLLLVYFMFSPFMLAQKADKSNGDIIVHIGKEAIENLLIPLPPLAEQKRIVAKVEQLLAAVRKLKTEADR